MSELFSIRMEGEKAIVEGRLFDLAKAKHLVRDAIEDIADEIEAAAKTKAPIGETGQLKLHPVDREDIVFGAVTGVPAFGTGTSIRGAGGRFVGASSAEPGTLLARTSISVAREPKYAIWVHNGTGIYGPRNKPITTIPPGKLMRFHWFKGRLKKNFALRVVKGQEPNPYLTEAYLLIERTFMPVRIERLRAQIALET